MDMIILYILLIAYIAAINFYAFLLVKTLAAKEREAELYRQASPLIDFKQDTENPQNGYNRQNAMPTPQTPPQRMIGKLCIAGALGGAITIYVCMFIFKYRRSDLLLMVLMPILGVLNVYLWVILFRSGFAFFVVR